MKRLFRLSILMLALILPATAIAYNFEVDGIDYYTISENQVSVIGGSVSGDLVIPSHVTYNGSTYAVTSIEGYAFEDCTGLTSVTIGKSITNIGENAFIGCTSLTTLNFNAISCADFNRREEYHPFYNLHITTINIGDSVQRIPAYFAYKKFITNIELPNSVITIGANAFYMCNYLTSAVLGESVSTIGDYAFYACARLENVNFPNSITTIGNYAFNICMAVSKIILGNSVSSIGHHAFDGCIAASKITLGNSLTSIGNYAFNNCSGLKKLYCSIGNPSLVTTGTNAFYLSSNNYNSRTLFVPRNSLQEYQASSDWEPYFGNIMEMDTSSIITFADVNVKAICIANWDTNCDSELSESEAAAVTDINLIFYKKRTITSFDELRCFTGLTAIGDTAFSNCSNLASITIPKNVTSIGIAPFANCPELGSINVVNDNPVFNSHNDCNAIIETASNTLILGGKNTIIPESVIRIGNNAFYGSINLTEIAIPNSVSSIGYSAFRGCSSLQSITIPSSVSAIGNSAFYNCTHLDTVYSYIMDPSAITMGSFVFWRTYENYSNRTLYVPSGTLEMYQADTNWSQYFGSIVEMNAMPGDINGDGNIAINDVTNLIDQLLSGDELPAYADVNGDGVVNIKDVTDLIDILLSGN